MKAKFTRIRHTDRASFISKHNGRQKNCICRPRRRADSEQALQVLTDDVGDAAKRTRVFVCICTRIYQINREYAAEGACERAFAPHFRHSQRRCRRLRPHLSWEPGGLSGWRSRQIRRRLGRARHRNFLTREKHSPAERGIPEVHRWGTGAARWLLVALAGLQQRASSTRSALSGPHDEHTRRAERKRSEKGNIVRH